MRSQVGRQCFAAIAIWMSTHQASWDSDVVVTTCDNDDGIGYKLTYDHEGSVKLKERCASDVRAHCRSPTMSHTKIQPLAEGYYSEHCQPLCHLASALARIPSERQASTRGRADKTDN